MHHVSLQLLTAVCQARPLSNSCSVAANFGQLLRGLTHPNWRSCCNVICECWRRHSGQNLGLHAETRIRTETKDQQKVKSIFSFGLSDLSANRWDLTLDSAIVETKVNPNLPHYALLVLHGKGTSVLQRLSFAELKLIVWNKSVCAFKVFMTIFFTAVISLS